MDQESLVQNKYNKEELIGKIKKSKLFGRRYSFLTRDIQTKNMSNLSKILFDEIRKHDDSVYEGKPTQVLLKLFFGGIFLETKMRYVESLNLKPESKEKIIDFMKKMPLLPNEDSNGFELGITRTVAIAAKYFTGKDRELIFDFIKILVEKKDIETIKSVLLKIDEQGTFYFTPGIVSNLLFAYDSR